MTTKPKTLEELMATPAIRDGSPYLAVRAVIGMARALHHERGKVRLLTAILADERTAHERTKQRERIAIHTRDMALDELFHEMGLDLRIGEGK